MHAAELDVMRPFPLRTMTRSSHERHKTWKAIIAHIQSSLDIFCLKDPGGIRRGRNTRTRPKANPEMGRFRSSEVREVKPNKGVLQNDAHTEKPPPSSIGSQRTTNNGSNTSSHAPNPTNSVQHIRSSLFPGTHNPVNP